MMPKAAQLSRIVAQPDHGSHPWQALTGLSVFGPNGTMWITAIINGDERLVAIMRA